MEQLLADNPALYQLVQGLQLQIGNLQQQIQQAAVAPAPTPASPPRRSRCYLALPDKFTGERSKFPAFLNQCRTFIASIPADFQLDETKVAFILSLLSGPAADWSSPLIDRQDPVLRNYARFCQLMEREFADPLRRQNATRRIRELRQGSRCVAEYISDFRRLAQEINWNEEALMEIFQDGLSSQILDEFRHTVMPATLDALYQLCLAIEAQMQATDARLVRRMVPVTGSAKPVPAPRRGFQTLPITPPIPAPRRNFQPLPAYTERRPVPMARDEPMDIGAARSRLTEAEKARRRTEGLCLYCGEMGHFVMACPQKRRGTAGPTPGSARPPTQQFQATLPGNGQSPA